MLSYICNQFAGSFENAITWYNWRYCL